MTKKILNPVTTKLKDVQRHLKALLPPDAVLVGHSLDLDLRALKVSIWLSFSSIYAFSIYFKSKVLGSSIPQPICFFPLAQDATHSILFPPQMIHPYVIDTSLLYVREQGRRFKLKFLAKAILG